VWDIVMNNVMDTEVHSWETPFSHVHPVMRTPVGELRYASTFCYFLKCFLQLGRRPLGVR
jgi:hypothetical protein